ncbi:CidA/LrgA family protein [Stutzerimonas urumqiensis]|uniref:CidA/LrgA family protein n=1 Tax=Stutzerimonas urumqiensis TaxID=638269 RepID=UPI003BA9F3C7
MLKGLTVLFFVQWLGTAVGLVAIPMVPGPILGMLLLLGWLMARGEISQSIDTAASGLLQYLPLLLVVPAVGIIDSGDLLLDDLPIIATALVLSLLVTVPLCGWLMQGMIKRAESRGEGRP